MKTGVALMGDGVSAAAAIGALAALRKLEIRVAAVSATGRLRCRRCFFVRRWIPLPSWGR